MASPFRIVDHQVPCQHIRQYPAATANEQEEPLYLAVKQYIPLDNPNPKPGDVTILAAHANGFPKVRPYANTRSVNAANIMRRNYMSRSGRKSTRGQKTRGCAFEVSGWPTSRGRVRAVL